MTFLLTMLIVPTVRAATFNAPPVEAAVKASNAFGLALYAGLRQGRENLICSPAGAAIALTMASAGARGATQSEMMRVLRLDSARPNASHTSFAALLKELNGRNGRDGVTLSVASRLWGQQGLQFRTDFLSIMRDRYAAPLALLDFLRAPAAAAAAINRWADENTHGQIPHIVDKLDTQTRLAVTNAVYFKGKWQTPFARNATHDVPFTTVEGTVSVPMMTRVDRMAYAHVAHAQIVELEYSGNLSMLVILPDAVDGLPTVERQLAQGYASWVKALSSREVDLQLPRWTTTSELVLNDYLRAMGMKLAFEKGKANFFGMADRAALAAFPGLPRLYLAQVLQKAWVQTKEQGTEAAAVTVVLVDQPASTAIPRPPVVFHADHPFIYIVRDRLSGLVLFIGRVGNPSRST